MYSSLISIALCAFILYGIVYLAKRNDKAKLVLYFLVSCIVVPLYEAGKPNGNFFFWFPVGFVIILISFSLNKDRQPEKITASLSGFAVSVILMIMLYQ